MTRLRAIRDRAVAVGVSWAAVKAAFFTGVFVGMLLMAVAMVGKEATLGLIKLGRTFVEAKL